MAFGNSRKGLLRRRFGVVILLMKERETVAAEEILPEDLFLGLKDSGG